MTDSDDPLAAKHERNQQQRIDEIKRWVQYVEENPPEVWGKQLNSLVESQLTAARESGVSGEQYERVDAAGREWRENESEPE